MSFVHPDLGPLRTGRHPHKVDLALPLFNDDRYMNRGLLPPIEPVVRRPTVMNHGNWGVMGNDRLSDCVAAACGHGIQVTSLLGFGTMRTPSDTQVEDLYWKTGDHQDTGRNCLQVLEYWAANSLDGEKPSAIAAIDFTHRPMHGQVRRAVQLFGFCYLAAGLPVSAQNETGPFNPANPSASPTWHTTVGPGTQPWSWGGHAIIAVAYDRYYVYMLTWGFLQRVTWGWFNKFCDEGYVVLLPSWLGTLGKSINGYDVAQLEADMPELGYVE